MGEIERQEPNIETKPDNVPDLKGILETIKKLMGGRELSDKEYKEARKYEDEKGPYYLEVKFASGMVKEKEDSERLVKFETEYVFMREGRFSECQSSKSEFHMIFLKDGEVVYGKSPVAKYLDDGIWEIVKDESVSN